MGLGADAGDIDRILRNEIPWRRWMLRHLVGDPTVSGVELAAAFGSWEHGLLRAALGAGEPPSDVVSATDAQRARSAEIAAAGAGALRAGEPDRAARLLLRALGEDPCNGAARYDVQVALKQAAVVPAPGAPEPLELRSHVTLTTAADLLQAPALLAAYARETGAGDDATLVVTYVMPSELGDLAALVDRLGLDGEASPDIVAQPAPATPPAQRLLAARASATLGAAPLAAAA